MFTCIGYKLPTFWEYMSIGEDSVRPSGAGLRNVCTFSYYAYLYWTLDRVVVRSRSQIVKPDAVFVVFLGIKWAHDIVEKNRS